MKIIICKHSWRDAFLMVSAPGTWERAGLEVMVPALQELSTLFQRKRKVYNDKEFQEGLCLTPSERHTRTDIQPRDSEPWHRWGKVQGCDFWNGAGGCGVWGVG